MFELTGPNLYTVADQKGRDEKYVLLGTKISSFSRSFREKLVKKYVHVGIPSSGVGAPSGKSCHCHLTKLFYSLRNCIYIKMLKIMIFAGVQQIKSSTTFQLNLQNLKIQYSTNIKSSQYFIFLCEIKLAF